MLAILSLSLLQALENIEKAIDAVMPKTDLTKLTSKFYTIIPHDFGRRVPPVITNKKTLQKMFDLLLVSGCCPGDGAE